MVKCGGRHWVAGFLSRKIDQFPLVRCRPRVVLAGIFPAGLCAARPPMWAFCSVPSHTRSLDFPDPRFPFATPLLKAGGWRGVHKDRPAILATCSPAGLRVCFSNPLPATCPASFLCPVRGDQRSCFLSGKPLGAAPVLEPLLSRLTGRPWGDVKEPNPFSAVVQGDHYRRCHVPRQPLRWCVRYLSPSALPTCPAAGAARVVVSCASEVKER